MENHDWDSVLQYVADPLDLPHAAEKPVAEPAAFADASQIPTPPDSLQGTPEDGADSGSTVVSVSTTFYPGAHLDPAPPDLVLLSADAVFFYVHAHTLLGASENTFAALLPAKPPKPATDLGPVLALPESANVANIVLHTIYNLSCAHYAPAVDTLLTAVDALHKYGVPLQRALAPGTPLYAVLLAQAPVAPIDVYAQAAAHDLYDLAVPISAHLLSYALPALSDALAQRMGPVYLKRLFFLHLGRMDALRRLLLSPPHPHAPTAACDFVEQKKLTRAWALASAYLAWDARPDLSTSAIESALCPLAEHLSCDVCQKALNDRVKQLIVQWSVVKRTI